MGDPLSGVEAKRARATDHLNTLFDATREFIESEPYVVTEKFDAERNRFIYNVAARRDPPESIGVILGDVVHNLRSALDHLVWQLVLLYGNHPGRWNQFPIYSGRQDFLTDVVHAERGPLHGIPQDSKAWTLIEQAQPYRRGKGRKTHALAVLRELSNEDKHRVVLQTLVSTRTPDDTAKVLSFDIERDIASIEAIWVRQAVINEQGTDVVELGVVPSGPNPKVQMYGEIPFDVAFGEVAIRVEALPALCGEVLRLLNSFKPLFG